jgi:AcrR family transcriptional regulator
VPDQRPESPSSRPGRQGEILTTFTELVAQKGYDVTSLSEIASRLQLSKGTIMYHFGSKAQMLREMSLQYMRLRLAELELIIESVTGNDAQLRVLILALVTSYRDDRASSVAFAREFMRFARDPVMADVRDLRSRYADGLYSLIEQGISEGTFRETDARIVGLQIIGMCSWIWTWFDPDARLSAEEIAAVFIETVLSGLVKGTPRRRPPVSLPAALQELRASARVSGIVLTSVR